MGIIRNLEDKIEHWTYDGLDEVNRAAALVNEMKKMELFNSLKTRLETYDKPFEHWALNKPLTDLAMQEICNADIANPIQEGLEYDGTRAIDGGEGIFREGSEDGGKAKNSGAL